MTQQKMQARISSLLSQHRSIDNRIQEEECRPCPDALMLAHMKKQRLRLKDEISSFSVA